MFIFLQTSRPQGYALSSATKKNFKTRFWSQYLPKFIVHRAKKFFLTFFRFLKLYFRPQWKAVARCCGKLPRVNCRVVVEIKGSGLPELSCLPILPFVFRHPISAAFNFYFILGFILDPALGSITNFGCILKWFTFPSSFKLFST